MTLQKRIAPAHPPTPERDPRAYALESRDVHVAYGNATILEGLTGGLAHGRITAFVGPNGSGKSTLLRTLARLLKPTSGAVLLEGAAVQHLSQKDLARKLAILPQSPEPPTGVTVRELVAYGRYPHQGLLGGTTKEDRRVVAWALQATGLAPLADRAVDTLSGGERQRAWIAMALAQQTGVLLLDEPTTFLDVRYQLEVLTLVRRLNREHGITVGWVLHDLNQAAAYSDHIVLLRSGKVFAEGTPEEVITPGNIRAVFGVEATVLPDPVTGTPTCIPHSIIPSDP